MERNRAQLTTMVAAALFAASVLQASPAHGNGDRRWFGWFKRGAEELQAVRAWNVTPADGAGAMCPRVLDDGRVEYLGLRILTGDPRDPRVIIRFPAGAKLRQRISLLTPGCLWTVKDYHEVPAGEDGIVTYESTGRKWSCKPKRIPGVRHGKFSGFLGFWSPEIAGLALGSSQDQLRAFFERCPVSFEKLRRSIVRTHFNVLEAAKDPAFGRPD